MNCWLLNGLDGGNPLAFLAAIGSLRTVTLAWPNYHCKLAWRETGGGWRPELTVNANKNLDLVAALAGELGRLPHCEAFTFSDNLTVDQSEFRSEAHKASVAATSANRRFADFLAAFGCEVIESRDKKGQIADTAFRTMSGAGHQHFLGTMVTLTKDTTAEHLRKALMDPWQYDDPVEKHTMRWDPRDDVRRALRWNDPSGDPSRRIQGSVWGANRLAIEGLPLLPTASVGKRLETTGFVHRRGEGVFWTWPIWEGLADVNVVRSLLALDVLRAEHPDRHQLAAHGIKEVYRCERITQGRYRNFTPAVPV